jgi:excisionase family DNA binding protein
MPRDLYQTVKEVGDRLEVSEATVRGWIKDGALRAIEIGKGWRIADRDLGDFLMRHETRARDADPAGAGFPPAAPHQTTTADHDRTGARFAAARPFGCTHRTRRDRPCAMDPSRDFFWRPQRRKAKGANDPPQHGPPVSRPTCQRRARRA